MRYGSQGGCGEHRHKEWPGNPQRHTQAGGCPATLWCDLPRFTYCYHRKEEWFSPQQWCFTCLVCAFFLCNVTSLPAPWYFSWIAQVLFLQVRESRGAGFTQSRHYKYGFYYTPSQVRTGTNLPGAAWWSLFPSPGGYNTDHPLPPQRSRTFPIRTQIYSWASSCDLPASTTCTTPGLQPWGPATQPADSAPWLCVSTDITPFPSSRCSIYLLLFLLSNKVCGFLAVIVLFQWTTHAYRNKYKKKNS